MTECCKMDYFSDDESVVIYQIEEGPEIDPGSCGGGCIGGIVGGMSGLFFGVIGGAWYYMKKRKGNPEVISTTTDATNATGVETVSVQVAVADRK